MVEQSLPILHIRDMSIFFGYHNKHRPSKVFNWVWDEVITDSDITLFMDNNLKDVTTCKSRVKVAWIVEPPVVHSHAYREILEYYKHYDRVYTFVKQLLDVDPRFRFCPWGTTFLDSTQYQTKPDKDRLLSIIASGKNWAPGHILRHDIIKRYSNRMDVMGHGYKSVDSKVEGLNRYWYSFAIENSIVDDYFTEKIVDCFLCRCVPLFWGTSRIGEFFDTRGVIQFSTQDDLGRILNSLCVEDYVSRETFIEENYQRALKYCCPDTNLWKAGVRGFFE